RLPRRPTGRTRGKRAEFVAINRIMPSGDRESGLFSGIHCPTVQIDSSVNMTALPVSGRLFDIAVIGGGVVGCAVTRRAALSGAGTILIEAASDILAGASKGNSA